MSAPLERLSRMQSEATIDDVYAHLGTETVASKDGRRCVDGRYESDSEHSGRLARPGGDFGYVMALLAVNRSKNLNLTPEQCVDAVYAAVTENDGQFFMHTDEHAEHASETTAIGCGHIAKAMNAANSSNYNVTPEEVAQALAYTRQKIGQGEKFTMVTLKGEHQERGVLVVTGTEKTVNPHKQDMFFVYDSNRDQQFIQQLVDRASIPGLTLEDMVEASKLQTQATLHLLAADKPIFEVNVDNDTPVVKEAGRIV
jgi:hypothetical protein